MANQSAMVHELGFNNLNGHDAEVCLNYMGEKYNPGGHFNRTANIDLVLVKSNRVVLESLIKLGIL